MNTELPSLPLRAGHMTIEELIHLYMSHYAGRDRSRVQRLELWRLKLGSKRLDELSDDDVHEVIEALAQRTSRFFAGKDAEGDAIFRAKKKPLAPATLNRYLSALSAVITWAIKRRVAPKGYVHPCRAVELRAENNEKTRFLTVEERDRLLAACKASTWSRLYLLVLLALTTGARKGELVNMRWADVDLGLNVVHVGRSKNGDPKVLPLIPSVVEIMSGLERKPGALLFASRVRPLQPFSFEGPWFEALKEAKIRAFRFHDLRHSCASFLAQNGATLLEIADLLGHRQMSMTKRYSHLAASHRTELVNRVLGDLR